MGLRAPVEFSATLTANTERLINVAGQVVTILEATGAFQLKMGDSGFSRARAGITYPLPANETFGEISLKDTSGASNTIILLVSFAEVRDSRLTLSAAVQVAAHPAFDSLADDSIGSTATEEIFAADSDRREAIISNPATNSATFRIGDSGAGAANGIPLPPGATLILTTTAAISAYNPAAGAESLALAATKAS